MMITSEETVVVALEVSYSDIVEMIQRNMVMAKNHAIESAKEADKPEDTDFINYMDHMIGVTQAILNAEEHETILQQMVTARNQAEFNEFLFNTGNYLNYVDEEADENIRFMENAVKTAADILFC